MKVAPADPASGLRTAPTAPAARPNAAEILASIGETVYEWSLADDRLAWGEDVERVLQVPDRSRIGRGCDFAQFLDPQNLTSRYDAVVNCAARDSGTGVPYQIQYAFLPKGKSAPASLWIEDTGRWFAGADGRPARAHGVVRAINERHEREQRLAHLGRYDLLTGLINRTQLTEVLSQALSDATRFRTSVGFLVASLENVGLINDAYGFEVADEVIAAVAQRFRATLRAGDTLGRFSGSKFGIVLMNCSEADLVIAAERLLGTVRGNVVATAHGSVAVSVAAGGVVVPRYAGTPHEAMACAQDALTVARQGGGHRGFSVYHHSPERTRTRRGNMELTREIVAALNEDRFALAYQPIVSAGTGRAALHECLLRLLRSDGSMIEANRFMPTVERLGLSRLVDERVLQLALSDLAEDPDIVLGINISAATATSAEWLGLLTSSVRRSGLGSRLIVEITETVAIQDVEETTRFVRALHDLGCRVAIDDFGAGYTSFRNLRTLEADLVKIDGSFIEKLHASKDDQIFVRALVDLARNCRLGTVAEWVRDLRDAALLREWGVDYLQGELYGPALIEKPWARPLKAATA